MGIKVSEIGEDLTPSLDDFIYLVKSPFTSDSGKRALLRKIAELVSPIKKAVIMLDDAAIKKLPNTRVEAVPTPGPGKMIQLIVAIYTLDTHGGAYVGVDGNEFYFLILEGGPGIANAGTTPGSASLGFADDKLVTIDFAQQSGFAGVPIASFEDKPLMFGIIGGPTDDLTGGDADNSLKATIYYAIVDL